MNAMAIAYEAYMRNSRKLNGLELQLIRGKTTLGHAGDIVNQVYDSYQDWETKTRAHYKYSYTVLLNWHSGNFSIKWKKQI